MPYYHSHALAHHLLETLAMPRSARQLDTEGTYHLIVRGNNRLKLFRYPRDHLAIYRRLLRYCRPQLLHVYHYCLMQTHLHMLCFVPDTALLPKIMAGFQLSYFHHYQRLYPFRGHLWHSRYRSIPITEESHLLQCARYIELNPVHAGMVGKPGDYPWSSYDFYATGKPDPLLYPNPFFVGEWGINRQEYRQFILSDIDPDYRRQIREYEAGVGD